MSKGVRLPSAVKRQGDAADAALRELNAPPREDDGQFVSEGEPQTDTDFSEPTGTTPEPTAPEATPEPGEDTGQTTDDDVVDWKAEAAAMKSERDRAVAAFQTLNGKYKAEVPRLQQQLRDLEGRLEQIQTAAPASTAAAPTEQLQVDGKGEAELREVYGDEWVDALKNSKREAAEQAKRDLREEFKPQFERLDRIEQRDAASADDAVFAEISKAHKDWEKINDLASFHEFLKETHPGTSMTRQDVIDAALRARKADPIIHQLSAFKRRAKTGNSALEPQVVPSDTGRTEPAKQPDKRIYSSKDIDAHNLAIAKLKSRGVPLTDEQKRLSALHDKALLEGRVQ